MLEESQSPNGTSAQAKGVNAQPDAPVTLIGAGALGCALAGALLTVGGRVQLAVRSGNPALRDGFLNFALTGRISGCFSVPVVELGRWIPPAGSEVWVTVRAWQLAELSTELERLRDTVLWIGSNGLGVTELLPRVSVAGRFLAWFGSRRGACESLGYELTPGGGLEWAFAGTVSPSLHLKRLQSEVFGGAEFPSLEAVEWRKAIWNCALNPLAALARVPNGEVITDSLLSVRFDQAVREGLQIAAQKFGPEAAGSLFGSEESYLQSLRTATQATGLNRNSLRVDLENGRSTELPWLLDRMIEEGARLKVRTPELFRLQTELRQGMKIS